MGRIIRVKTCGNCPYGAVGYDTGDDGVFLHPIFCNKKNKWGTEKGILIMKEDDFPSIPDWCDLDIE